MTRAFFNRTKPKTHVCRLNGIFLQLLLSADRRWPVALNAIHRPETSEFRISHPVHLSCQYVDRDSTRRPIHRRQDDGDVQNGFAATSMCKWGSTNAVFTTARACGGAVATPYMELLT